MTKSIKVFAPATVANVTCGFDILGFAVNEPGDEIIVKLSSSNTISRKKIASPSPDKSINFHNIKITKITGDNKKLPLDPTKNTAAVAIAHFLGHIKSNVHVEIIINKKMPLSSGLGSSAASAAAAVVAINELLETSLSRNKLVPFAMEGERAACGVAHADNVAPSLLGGFILIRSYNPLDIIKIPTPGDLHCSIIHPHIIVATKDARDIIKTKVSLSDAIIQWGNVGGLIAGLMLTDYPLIARSMHDIIIEPARAILFPGFVEIKRTALDSGALGVGISGSGPSIFALCKSKNTATKVASAMKNAMYKLGIDNEIFVSEINQIGAKILE